RLNEADVQRAGDVATIQEQLRVISERQDEGDARSGSTGSHAPFAIDKVVGSVVELVCIDNRNTSTYYTGSGTVVDPSGLVVTNRHVLISEDGSLIRYCGVGFTSSIELAPKIEYV